MSVSSISVEELQNEWDKLVNTYNMTVRNTSGCGSRGQIYIDNAYQLMIDFSNNQPDFKPSLPKRTTCYNDGFGGMATGLGSFSNRW